LLWAALNAFACAQAANKQFDKQAERVADGGDGSDGDGFDDAPVKKYNKSSFFDEVTPC
jgi:hypothetical protein